MKKVLLVIGDAAEVFDTLYLCTASARTTFRCSSPGRRRESIIVVVCGNIATARTWHDNWAWMREFMKLLNRPM
jgi:hypothetical protein